MIVHNPSNGRAGVRHSAWRSGPRSRSGGQEQLKARFQQLDIWMVKYPIEVISKQTGRSIAPRPAASLTTNH
jgi:hypothetical protein